MGSDASFTHNCIGRETLRSHDESPLYVLCQVRRLVQAVIIWADTLCIDQNDELERSHQVKLMRDIYGGSKEALVCLRPDEGPESDLFDAVPDHLGRYSQSANR